MTPRGTIPPPPPADAGEPDTAVRGPSNVRLSEGADPDHGLLWPNTAREEQLLDHGRRMGPPGGTLTRDLALALLPVALLVFAGGIALGRWLGAWP